MNAIKSIVRIASIVAVVALLVGARTSSVQAYGSTAMWQIAISANCTNTAYCGQSLGGFWGWVELDQGSQGDATLTGCDHMVAAGPVHVAGAGHINMNITSWDIEAGSAGPQTFIAKSGTLTITGNGGPFTIPFTNFDLGVPAAPGHYSTLDVLGFSAPGVTYQIQVVELSH